MNDISLLGGAQRGKTRPRGFAPWKPQAAALAQEAPSDIADALGDLAVDADTLAASVEVLISRQRHPGG